MYLNLLVQEQLKTHVQHSLSLKLLKPCTNHLLKHMLKYCWSLKVKTSNNEAFLWQAE